MIFQRLKEAQNTTAMLTTFQVCSIIDRSLLYLYRNIVYLFFVSRYILCFFFYIYIYQLFVLLNPHFFPYTLYPSLLFLLFYIICQEVDMTNLIALRTKHKEEFEKSHGVKLGFMSAFVRVSNVYFHLLLHLIASLFVLYYIHFLLIMYVWWCCNILSLFKLRNYTYFTYVFRKQTFATLCRLITYAYLSSTFFTLLLQHSSTFLSPRISIGIYRCPY